MKRNFVNLWKQITKIRRIQKWEISTSKSIPTKASPHTDDHKPQVPEEEKKLPEIDKKLTN